jgi:hypothetical protein
MSAYTLLDWAAVNGNRKEDIGIIKPLVTNELLLRMPFKVIEGFKYERSLLLEGGGVTTRKLNEEYAKTKNRYGKYEAETALIGGAAELDIKLYQKGKLDLLADDMVEKIKNIGKTFTTFAINGDRDVNQEHFNGLIKHLIASQVILAGDNPDGAVLSKKDVERLLALIEGGANTLIMNAKAKVVFKDILEKLITYYEISALSKKLLVYGDAAILTVPESDITCNEVCGSSTDTTSIYGLRIEENTGLFGIADAASPTIGKLIEYTTKVEKAVEWNVGIACPNAKVIGRLKGVKLG